MTGMGTEEEQRRAWAETIDNPSTRKALDPRRPRDYYASYWRWQWAVALQATKIGGCERGCAMAGWKPDRR